MEPTLEQYIKTAHRNDSEVDQIKSDLASNKPSDFSLDKDGALFFKDRLVVPQFDKMTEKIMKEAHDTPLSIHPGSTKMYQDIR
jgi:hypothetical protein